jgi:hypothetical protein
MFRSFTKSNIWTRSVNASIKNEYSNKAWRAIKRSTTIAQL